MHSRFLASNYPFSTYTYSHMITFLRWRSYAGLNWLNLTLGLWKCKPFLWRHQVGNSYVLSLALAPNYHQVIFGGKKCFFMKTVRKEINEMNNEPRHGEDERRWRNVINTVITLVSLLNIRLLCFLALSIPEISSKLSLFGFLCLSSRLEVI